MLFAETQRYESEEPASGCGGCRIVDAVGAGVINSVLGVVPLIVVTDPGFVVAAHVVSTLVTLMNVDRHTSVPRPTRKMSSMTTREPMVAICCVAVRMRLLMRLMTSVNHSSGSPMAKPTQACCFSISVVVGPDI